MTQRRVIVCFGLLAATTFLFPSSAAAQSSGAPVHHGIQNMRGTAPNRTASASPAAANNPQNGTITTFDAPGASQGTFAQSINDFGAIAGYCTDASFVSHGFVRDPLGHITTFDDPNATSGTFALSVNAFGAVAGYYSDKNGFPQSFVRGPLGNFLTLPGKGANYGMVVLSINDFGATAGYETAATN